MPGAESSNLELWGNLGLVSLPLPRAMSLVLNDLLDWSAADDVPYEAQLHSQSAHEQGVSPGNLYVKRVEMLNV